MWPALIVLFSSWRRRKQNAKMEFLLSFALVICTATVKPVFSLLIPYGFYSCIAEAVT